MDTLLRGASDLRRFEMLRVANAGRVLPVAAVLLAIAGLALGTFRFGVAGPAAAASPGAGPSPVEVSSTAGVAASPLGDVNCDGAIDSVDSFLILLVEGALFGFLPCPENGDVNLDGLFNSLDALLILQFHARLVPALPPPGLAGGG